MRRLFVTAMLLVAATLITGCHAGTSNRATTRTIDIMMVSGHPTPAGATVHVVVGQSVQLQIKAQHGGTLTLHTFPAQSFHYGMGTTLVPVGSFDSPGTIRVTSYSATSSVIRIEVDGAA